MRSSKMIFPRQNNEITVKITFQPEKKYIKQNLKNDNYILVQFADFLTLFIQFFPAFRNYNKKL